MVGWDASDVFMAVQIGSVAPYLTSIKSVFSIVLARHSHGPLVSRSIPERIVLSHERPGLPAEDRAVLLYDFSR